MVDYIQLLILGAIAGFTIFLGIPFALVPAKQKTKSFLNSIAIGILLFILYDVLEHSWEKVSDNITTAWTNGSSLMNGTVLLLTMIIGIAIGLIGLAIYQEKFMGKNITPPLLGSTSDTAIMKKEIPSTKLALMIAIGIGVHNLSEGLAIGQSYASNEISLAILLIVGFGAHNATEGFGIVGPLAGNEERPSMSYLFQLGLIGGGPTFLGTLIGSFFVSDIANVLFLSLAGGALIFVVLLMYNSIGKNVKIPLIMSGIFIGLTGGFLTDLVISLAGV